MCGIAGIQVSDKKKIQPAALDRLQTALFHRGPDAQNHLIVNSTGLVITRLAIVDLVHGDQPFISTNGAVLIANGEIYNAPELRKRFPDYPFRSESDCESILPVFESYDLDFASHLRGMFAIALVDQRTGQLMLARDQFGIKPLYFVEAPGFFAFASELSALLDAGFAEREISDSALHELLQSKYVFGTKTINPHIQRLAPGETIVVEDGKICRRRGGTMWPPHVARNSRSLPHVFGFRSPPALLKKFEQAIFDSVAVHLRADAAWRLFYSGGLDSTILMLAAREVSTTQTQALTIGYDGQNSSDESWEALRLSRSANVSCERMEMTNRDFWTLAPRIAAAMDDPMADPAVLPLYMLGAMTRRLGAKVALCGEGADEIFGGYSRYRRATLPWFMRRGSGRRGVFTGSPVPIGGFAGWSRALDALERSQAKLWSSPLQILQAIDILERLPNCLLIKLDRALMASGVEGRTPFLDREVLRFSNTVPDRLKANPWQGKRLLRDWLARAFPEARPYARKRGFDVPIARWMHGRREELGALVSAQPGVARLIDATAVKRTFSQCLKYDQPAWSLLFYALWHSHHILRISCEGDISATLTDAAKIC
jgi:asparagine synthase (glutamine-hydrolysing)